MDDPDFRLPYLWARHDEEPRDLVIRERTAQLAHDNPYQKPSENHHSLPGGLPSLTSTADVHRKSNSVHDNPLMLRLPPIQFKTLSSSEISSSPTLILESPVFKHSPESFTGSLETTASPENSAVKVQKAENPTVFDEKRKLIPICEFSSPCRMTPSPDGMHFRKVVSHVFGRNKASTKLFPASVWVHYCRKHYQRARYRADQWPFTQCELLLESLSRMERWNGVDSFELILRRREVMRVEGENRGAVARNTTSSSGFLQTGRKHPTAIISPVPEWLRDYVGHGKSFGEIRTIILNIREHMVRLRKKEKKSNHEENETTNEFVQTHSASNRIRNSVVRFPDIEILPTFKKWVLDAALRQRETVKEAENYSVDESEHLSDGTTQSTVQKYDDVVNHGPEIGRAGVNQGSSQSQRRRSQRGFLHMVNRVTRRGSVKKPIAK
ncbi:hypothetical protein N7462_002094 [Penicillium macrosclerotiorum]|uniref:uncharacterized protein n=1 Tax=Penicillium macrosclerotiorum TaxID=303699 RepID=UPI002546581E|nr:uncharacterized protein N7462_002094 [Penicillium macrosclerotiorum]KAJ5692671.1 hypothetical protein N7462_002094 [Penicillium macrosclerotiorum]